MSKNSLPFQIINGTVPGMFDTKIHEYFILISRQNRFVRQKRNRKRKIVDTIHINELQKLDS